MKCGIFLPPPVWLLPFSKQSQVNKCKHGWLCIGWCEYKPMYGGCGGSIGRALARDPMDSTSRGSNLVQSTRKICDSFSESKCCADSSVCRTHKKVCTLKILKSMSEFGGLWKYCTQEEKTNWVAPYYGCSLSPGKAAQISHALHWDKKIILSHLILSYLYAHRHRYIHMHISFMCVWGEGCDFLGRAERETEWVVLLKLGYFSLYVLVSS